MTGSYHRDYTTLYYHHTQLHYNYNCNCKYTCMQLHRKLLYPTPGQLHQTRGHCCATATATAITTATSTAITTTLCHTGFKYTTLHQTTLHYNYKYNCKYTTQHLSFKHFTLHQALNTLHYTRLQQHYTTRHHTTLRYTTTTHTPGPTPNLHQTTAST